MAKYLPLPDGSSVKVNDDATQSATVVKAIEKFPQLFYVDKIEKCGKEPYYIALPLTKGGYACGFEAHLKSIKSNGIVEISNSPTNVTQNNDLDNTNLATAFGASAIAISISISISIVIGIAFCFCSYKKFNFHYKSKIEKILLFTVLVSFGMGIAGIANEILGWFLLGLPLRNDRVVQFAIANIVIVPAIIWAVNYILSIQTKHTSHARSDGSTSYKTNIKSQMTTQVKHRWGILTVAIVMFFVTLFLTTINGPKSSVYLIVWFMVGYYAYKARLTYIKTLIKIVIFINVAVLALVMLFLDAENLYSSIQGGKNSLIVSVLVMLVPKLILYFYCTSQIKKSSESQHHS